MPIRLTPLIMNKLQKWRGQYGWEWGYKARRSGDYYEQRRAGGPTI